MVLYPVGPTAVSNCQLPIKLRDPNRQDHWSLVGPESKCITQTKYLPLLGCSSGHVWKVSDSVRVTCVATSCVRWVIEWHVWWLLAWSDMTGAILLCPGIWNNKAISRCFCIFKTKKNSKTWVVEISLLRLPFPLSLKHYYLSICSDQYNFPVICTHLFKNTGFQD